MIAPAHTLANRRSAPLLHLAWGIAEPRGSAAIFDPAESVTVPAGSPPRPRRLGGRRRPIERAFRRLLRAELQANSANDCWKLLCLRIPLAGCNTGIAFGEAVRW